MVKINFYIYIRKKIAKVLSCFYRGYNIVSKLFSTSILSFSLL